MRLFNADWTEMFPLRAASSCFEPVVTTSGWIVLRAWNDGADPHVLDIYPYATTSPVYLQLPGGLPPDPEDAAYFAAWLDRDRERLGSRLVNHPPAEFKSHVL